MPYEQLHSPAFLERVQRSADYFKRQLSDIFDVAILQTRRIKTGSKVALQRLNTATSELAESVEAKERLLAHVAAHGFTVGDYLHAKQIALLDVIQQSASPTHAKTKRTAKKAKEQKKVPTREITYDFFSKGLSITDIAKLRNLAPSTIFNHLLYYIEEGKLKASDLVSKEKRDIIEHAIAQVGTTGGLTPIKNLCDESITFDDIRAVMKEYMRNENKVTNNLHSGNASS